MLNTLSITSIFVLCSEVPIQEYSNCILSSDSSPLFHGWIIIIIIILSMDVDDSIVNMEDPIFFEM